MNKIFINDKIISKYQKSKYTLIIVSGTTLSYFPEDIFNEILENIKSICNSFENKNCCGNYEYDKDFRLCFSFESNEKMESGIYQYWPNISFISEDYQYK